MISRRIMLLGGGLLAAVATRLSDARPATANPIPAVLRLEDLTATPATGQPMFIPGQGWFESTLPDGEADGVVHISGPDGRHWKRCGFDGALHPGWFARPEDGEDQSLAIQRACDHARKFGPFAVELGNAVHRCLSILRIDPTRVALRGSGARLDYSAMPEPPASDPVATLDNIVPSAGWRRDAGALMCDDGGGETLSLDLELPGDGRYRISATIGALEGSEDFPSLRIAMLAPGREPLATLVAASPGPFYFEVTGPQQAVRLTLETGSAVRLESLTVSHHGLRECVLISSGETSPQYGHKWMEGIEIVGPGAGTALHGMRFESFAMARSARIEMQNVTVRGFDTGLVLSHRCYLLRGTAMRINCGVGVHFLGGLEDAGELISFQGGVIDGGRIAILNNGAEISFFGTSIDFADQVFVGTGQLNLVGCHVEMNRPKAADKPLVDLGIGNVAVDGGSFSVTGNDFEAGNLCDHIFELRSPAATASLREVTPYNLRTQSGALAGGPGRLDTALMRGRRPRHIAPIVQFAQGRNLLGPMPLDLRASDGPGGGFQMFPTTNPSFKASQSFRYIWLVGRARPGSEVGVHLRMRSDVQGELRLALQALAGDVRTPIGNGWAFKVGPDWKTFLGDSNDTHPSAATSGRMPEGSLQIGLMLDLTGIDGTVEFADAFLCAI
ncbi:hypothetical protein PVT71_27510 (plasmid) [Salipiger sp. H15]|uniref:Right-handed parallel beta-helix repeat-containing protein n=1 Tax=Alloyangia sp. H15 TaxID=3029062 RepID=A0AAU8ARM6_9RHOB